MLDIIPVPAFTDNYIWLLHDGRHAVAVDPGEAEPVVSFLDANDLELKAILCTHHHGDHIGGIAKLRELYNVPVYGPRLENISGVTHPLGEGDKVSLAQPALECDVIDIRGHTRGHIGYQIGRAHV